MSELRLRTEGLEWREVDDEVIAVDVRTSTYVSTNGTGAVLWRALAGGATRDGLVAALREQFDLDAGQAEEDVDRFLTDLRERELLEG